MSAWVPVACPMEACGYVCQLQLEKTGDYTGELIEARSVLAAEHPDHPGGLDEIYTADPAVE